MIHYYQHHDLPIYYRINSLTGETTTIVLHAKKIAVEFTRCHKTAKRQIQAYEDDRHSHMPMYIECSEARFFEAFTLAWEPIDDIHSETFNSHFYEEN